MPGADRIPIIALSANAFKEDTEAPDLLDDYDHQTVKRPEGNPATYYSDIRRMQKSDR